MSTPADLDPKLAPATSLQAAAKLAELVFKGQPAAIARAISLVENSDPGSKELLTILAGYPANSKIIGITGLPGAGKSSLLNALLRELRAEGKTAAVLVIDPSSMRSGGALLGDRVRFDEGWKSEEVFVRSLALRGGLGGLSETLFDVLRVIFVAGYDYIFIETVGVGQADIAIRQIAALVLLVLVPGTGDELQLLKGGIMEIPDMLVLNKADLPGADGYALQLRGYSNLPSFAVSATHGQGIAELYRHLVQTASSAENTFDAAFVVRQKLLQHLAELLEAALPKGSLASPNPLLSELTTKLDALLSGSLLRKDAP